MILCFLDFDLKFLGSGIEQSSCLNSKFIRQQEVNETLHNGVLQKTDTIADEIMAMDACTLWWLDQWVEERKTRLPKEDRGLESYKRWVWKNNKKAEAGMTNVRTTPTRTRNTGGGAAGSN